MKMWIKTVAMILTATVALSAGAASAGVASVKAADTTSLQGDVAKMYLIRHELKFELKGTKGTLDGKSINVDQPILRDGRVFVPVRTLQQSGAADIVEWNAAKREVRIVINRKISPSFSELRYRIGSDKVYTAEGTTLPDASIAAPFISGGRVYVPVRPLNTYHGIAVELNNGVVTWNWSEKILEVLKHEWKTDEAQTTFTILYQKDMNPPSVLSSLGSGGWGGSSSGRSITQKDIALDGRLYNRISLTEVLQPGVNPLLLTAMSTGEAKVTAYRKVKDSETIPVTLMYYGEGLTKVTAPTRGYVKLKVGESLTIAGEILQPNAAFDEVTLSASKYDPALQDFKPAAAVKVPIKDNTYAGVLKFDQSGSYWVYLMSPKYLSSVDMGPFNAGWARIVVEVE